MRSEISHTLLIVDDDEAIRKQLRWAFDSRDVVLAGNRRAAIEAMETVSPPVVLLDLGLPPDPHGPTEGLATLDAILSAEPMTKVIIMTGQTERDYAVRAVGRGAYDFYQKPIEIETLTLIVERAFALHGLEVENHNLMAGSQDTGLPGFITGNAEMIKVCAELRQLAASTVSVLILGESGTGKEVLAHAVHSLSDRAQRRFVAINCAAIPENLLESEVFGHEKGAFTGAVKTTPGKAELANGGTLFLDEIGDMPPALQAKLFRFLQDRTIERVGGRQPIAVDIRVIAATNQHLETMMEEGTFRSELFYRLSEAVVQIPPLRERPDDAALIAHHLLHKIADEQGRHVRGFTSDAISAVLGYAWPGNVRELENRIKRAVVACRGPSITAADLGFADDAAGNEDLTLRAAREKADRTAITRALLEAGGNISKAARILDVSRPTLYQLLKDYDLKA